jgi:hypothetical protein
VFEFFVNSEIILKNCNILNQKVEEKGKVELDREGNTGRRTKWTSKINYLF